MIVLDTNVVSELMRLHPEKRVMAWLGRHLPSNLFITTMTVTELRFGAVSHPLPDRKNQLNLQIDEQLDFFGSSNLLSIDLGSAEICADLMWHSKDKTPEAKTMDLQIAAIAIRCGFAVATRDVKDFQHQGLRVINPWTD